MARSNHGKRFQIVPVQHFDVIDTSFPEAERDGSEIKLNTRDKAQAEALADELEEHFAPDEEE